MSEMMRDVQPDKEPHVRRLTRGGGIHGALKTREGHTIGNFPFSERRFSLAEQNRIAVYFERVASMTRVDVPEFPTRQMKRGPGLIECAQALADTMANADIDTMRLVAHVAQRALARVERYHAHRQEHAGVMEGLLGHDTSPVSDAGEWWLASAEEEEGNRRESAEAMGRRRMYARGRS